MTAKRKALLERLFFEHGAALTAFFRRRVRLTSDAPDLAQEVYVRMLNISNMDAIRNPELYLYTVANNLVKEQAVLDRRRSAAQLPESGFGRTAVVASIPIPMALRCCTGSGRFVIPITARSSSRI